MIAHQPRLADMNSAANRQRASQAGRQQAVLARLALAALQTQRPTAHRDRWIRALQHRISNADGALAELGQTMTPPLTKHAYAALLRRALRGGGMTAGHGHSHDEGEAACLSG
jgi:DNA-binding transcriptional regulator WhiA